jgi:hypothetical protein
VPSGRYRVATSELTALDLVRYSARAGGWGNVVTVLRDLPLASISLRDQRDADGLRHLGVTRRPDGGILIEGQELGPGVERIFGAGLTGSHLREAGVPVEFCNRIGD